MSIIRWFVHVESIYDSGFVKRGYMVERVLGIDWPGDKEKVDRVNKGVSNIKENEFVEARRMIHNGNECLGFARCCGLNPWDEPY